jgi:hypothetical protein
VERPQDDLFLTRRQLCCGKCATRVYCDGGDVGEAKRFQRGAYLGTRYALTTRGLKCVKAALEIRVARELCQRNVINMWRSFQFAGVSPLAQRTYAQRNVNAHKNESIKLNFQ